MAKFELGQRVKVMHGGGEPFTGCITEINPPKTYYRVEAQGKDGRPYTMTVEEGWLELDREPKAPVLDTACFAQSLKSLVFSVGGSHVAGWVEEAERAAREGKVIRYE